MSSSTSISDTDIVVFDPFNREREETDRNKDRQGEKHRQTETGRQTDRQTTDRELEKYVDDDDDDNDHVDDDGPHPPR